MERINMNKVAEHRNTIGDKFSELLDSMVSDDKGKYDFYTNLKSIEYNDGTGNLVITDRHKQVQNEFECTQNGMAQILNRLGIPSQYAAKQPTWLLKPQFDYWKSEAQDRELLIRAKEVNGKHTARAFLSDGYNRLDNKDVADAFIGSIPKKDYTVVDYHMTDDMVNMRVILDNYTYKDNDGPQGRPNKYFTGLHIINGETGNYPVSVDLIIWEQWCSNGSVRRFNNDSVLSRRHVGKDIGLVDLFGKALTSVSAKAEETIGLFVNSKNVKIADPVAELYKIMNSNKELFPESFHEIVYESYWEKPSATVYGISSAITQAAHSVSYDKRLKLEKLAGDLIFKAA